MTKTEPKLKKIITILIYSKYGEQDSPTNSVKTR